MRTRRTIGAMALAAVALLAMGCGDGDDDAEDTTTTEATTETTATTTTLSAEEYTAAIEEFSATIDAAGTDLCAITDALLTSPPPPADEAQMEQVVVLYAELLRALAATSPDDPETAQAFETAADQLLVEAEEAGYPVDFLSGETAPPSLSSEEFLAANEALQVKGQAACAPAEGDATTTTVAG
jgi:hypothetical protein